MSPQGVMLQEQVSNSPVGFAPKLKQLPGPGGTTWGGLTMTSFSYPSRGVTSDSSPKSHGFLPKTAVPTTLRSPSP